MAGINPRIRWAARKRRFLSNYVIHTIDRIDVL